MTKQRPPNRAARAADDGAGKKLPPARKKDWPPARLAGIEFTLGEKIERLKSLAARMGEAKIEALAIDGDGDLEKGLIQIDVFLAKAETVLARERLARHRSRASE